jgi:hypothetical protein
MTAIHQSCDAGREIVNMDTYAEGAGFTISSGPFIQNKDSNDECKFNIIILGLRKMNKGKLLFSQRYSKGADSIDFFQGLNAFLQFYC